ncbi:helix-turn-helix domain-containing protein [Mangrovimonas aestuarii]|uniref:helix-turn-helix domain-containing protein n=1 Tax=Mangrovimonas aestuarii TaxID=3018443 RepID=UPI002378F0E3|nr:helix-turn-helix domain-containing protein [Mangrovimonas aestuarii]
MENPFELINERLDRIEKLLKDLNNKIDGNSENYTTLSNIMNIEQLASYLTLSKSTIYGMVNKRKIPHFKRGKRLYFDKGDINEWLRDGKVLTMTEIEQKANEYILKNPLR